MINKVKKFLANQPLNIGKVANAISGANKITREDVEFGYRFLLGREPESEGVIIAKMNAHHTRESLIQEFITSEEFKIRVPINNFSKPALVGHEPPIYIEEVDEDNRKRLFNHIQEAWQHLGDTEPYYSVLSSDEYMTRNIEVSKEDFYNSGESEVEKLIATLKRNHIDISSIKSCLEYGCGVGRVTKWLNKKIDRIVAIDISSSHLKLAKEVLGNEESINFRHMQDLSQLDKLENVDLVYSFIVLQHNPPPVIERIIEFLLKSLNTGGIAYFQVPTYRINYKFEIEKYLSKEGKKKEIEMHILPQKRVFELIYENNCQVLEILEDTWTGSRYKELSNTFLVRRE